METTPEQSKLIADMIAAQEARKLASQAKAKEAMKPAQATPLVEGQSGSVTVDGRPIQGIIAKDPEVNGEEFVGRNPEEVVLREKRTDWDPKKG